jgi:C-terminal processing protease CtpA/Prc
VINPKSSSGQLRTSMTTANAFIQFVMLLIAGALAACGGGGGGAPAFSPPPPPPAGGSGWQQDVFLDASTFFTRCAVPRSGIDPNTGAPYQDIQGTILDENNFLRSYSDDTYLWYSEIVDQDPGLFSSALIYFDELRTDATTPSGADKDKFHFTFDSEEWFQLSQSGASAGYGAEFIFLSTVPPREVVIAYTEPNSPATTPPASLARGATLLTIDGVDINDNTQVGVDALNAGLFPAGAGETHTFEVLDLGAQNSRIVTMTTAIITEDPVQSVATINTPTGDVGYLVFNAHRAPAEAELIAAINQLQGVGDLVLDIRYNGGGFLDMAGQLAYMIAGDVPTAGQTFEAIQFNDKHPSTNPVTGQPLAPTPFHNQTLGFSVAPGQALPTLDLDTVYVLTGPNTCSASEAIMNGLRGVNVNVIQIGSTTCGKPYGFYPTDNCGTTYFTIQFRGINAMNFGDYTDGFSPSNTQGTVGTVLPGCSVGDDFTAQLGDTSEARLAAALMYRTNQSCPAPSGFAQPGLSKPGAPLSATDGIIPRSLWDSNRIYRQ